MAEQKIAADHNSLTSASRSVSIELSNFSTNILINPQVFTDSGHCYGAPQPTVEKGAVATCSFAKIYGVPCGAVGVLTYDITEDRKTKAVERLAIMFCVPFNYIFYTNLFSLGLFDIREKNDKDLFESMYHKTKPEFKRGMGSGFRNQIRRRKVHSDRNHVW
uniref:Uncharacterized protein n=1 Tax=Anguilla anguilla TaxID=7936 RepID=A0A0E9X0L9_ANGAN